MQRRSAARFVLSLLLAPAACGDGGGSSDAGISSGSSAAATSMTDAEPTTAASDTAASTGPLYDVGHMESTGTGGCMELQFEGQPTPPDVFFVLDRSGSMTSLSGPMRTRWDDLLDSVAALVADYDDRILMGARFLPPAGIPHTEPCDPEMPMNTGVEVPVAPNNGAAILQALADAEPYGNDTPTLPAVQAGLTHLQGLAGQRGDQVLVIVADGETNACGTPEEIEAELAAAYNGGLEPSVVTYAISVGWTIDELQGYAEAGGSGTYISTDDLATLTAALDQIVGDVVSCTIHLDPPPEHPDSIEIRVDGVPYENIPDCAAGDGWVWSSPEKDAVELCGAACDALTATGTADITYHCPLG